MGRLLRYLPIEHGGARFGAEAIRSCETGYSGLSRSRAYSARESPKSGNGIHHGYRNKSPAPLPAPFPRTKRPSCDVRDSSTRLRKEGRIIRPTCEILLTA